MNMKFGIPCDINNILLYYCSRLFSNYSECDVKYMYIIYVLRFEKHLFS